MIILTLILAFVFFALGAIHVYWAFGGERGFEGALPTNLAGDKLLNPRPIESAIVALGLLLFSSFYFSGMVGLEIPGWIELGGKWLIPIIFLIRAVGDFRYVGLFKKVRTTAFGKRDAMVFTPLCLFVAFFGFIYAFVGN